MENEALSAASLLVAILSVLYSTWYNDITFALGIKSAQHKSDNVGKHGTVKRAFRAQLIPLVLASTLTTLTFIPISFSYFWISANQYFLFGFQALLHYNTVQTAYVLVTLISLSLSIHLINQYVKFRKLLKKLSPD